MLEELFLLSRHLINIGNRAYRRRFISILEQKNRMSIITGQRGVGKTTVIVQYLNDCFGTDSLSQDYLYVQADRFIVGTLSMYEIAKTFYGLGGKLLCLDEIHKYPGWSKELKSIHDTFDTLRVIVTGSSALHVHEGSHDLSRRAVVFKMHGFSFREYIELKLGITLPVLKLDDILRNHEQHEKTIITAAEKNEKKVLALFKDYLVHGYYPYHEQYGQHDLFFKTVEQSMHTTIENDLLSLHPSLTGTSIRKIKKLLSFIAASVPFTPDMQKLKKICDIGDERTLKTYLSFLEDGEVISMLSAATRKIAALEKPEKIYLQNTNQMNALRPLDRNAGTLRETFFIAMLKTLHQVTAPARGDLLVDNCHTFEIGGAGKGLKQIENTDNAFRVIDDCEYGFKNTIPLWLFGFLY